MSFTIREAGEQDLACLIAVETACQSHPWSGAVMARYLRHPQTIWVAEDNGRCAGFAVVTRVAGEAELLDLAVHPDHQGLGLGRQLLKHVLELARSGACERIFLEVRRSNDRAIQLYETMGFCEVGVRKNYYPSGKGREDALLYCQELLD